MSRDPTLDAMRRVVADAEGGVLSLDKAEAMMGHLRASPWNPPRTYAHAYAAMIGRDRVTEGDTG